MERGPVGCGAVEMGVKRDYHVRSGEAKASAEKCAEAIRKHWLSEGKRVKVWVEAVSHRAKPNHATQILYVVKSEGIPGAK